MHPSGDRTIKRMNTRNGLMQLQGGGHVAFTEYGDPNGQPVLFCHGWPSSRSMARITETAAEKIGIRIISPDRPGISESSFQAGRKLLDWPRVARALIDHLELSSVRLLAISGGA